MVRRAHVRDGARAGDRGEGVADLEGIPPASEAWKLFGRRRGREAPERRAEQRQLTGGAGPPLERPFSPAHSIGANLVSRRSLRSSLRPMHGESPTPSQASGSPCLT